MKYPRFILFSACTIFTSLAAAQSDNCQSIGQLNGNLNVPIEVSGNSAVAVLNTEILPIGISTALARDIGLEVDPVASRNVIWRAFPSITGQVSDVPIKLFDQDTEIEQMYVVESEQRFVYLSLLMFKDLIMQINFPESQLCFLNPRAINLQEAANINMRSSIARPAVQVALNNNEEIWVELQLDFQGAIRLDKESAESLGIVSDGGELQEDSANGGDFSSASADSLTFGPYELGNIDVSYPVNDVELNSDQQRLQQFARGRNRVETNGILGYEILKHFTVTVDFESELMHIYVQ
jgi:hypothetical protein